MQKKYCFIDRDGTLIIEPGDQQVDSLEKLEFMPGVFVALTQLQQAGYELVMVTNQDGLGTKTFPEKNFLVPQQFMMKVFESQGITFSDIKICPHFEKDCCDCRKPKIGLLLDYLKEQVIDRDNSYVIGDRDSDFQLAKNIGVAAIKIGTTKFAGWRDIVETILNKPRTATVTRKTNETDITVEVNLDDSTQCEVNTGIGFFDHMLEQLSKHAGMRLKISVQGDLQVDDHHTVEDVALALGSAISKALGDKRGIERYGFMLPMDECLANSVIDLSGRPFCQFNAKFKQEKVGELSAEMVPHFFRSLADSLRATIRITVVGENTHHMVEAAFKGFARCLKQAVNKQGSILPTTKGLI